VLIGWARHGAPTFWWNAVMAAISFGTDQFSLLACRRARDRRTVVCACTVLARWWNVTRVLIIEAGNRTALTTANAGMIAIWLSASHLVHHAARWTRRWRAPINPFAAIASRWCVAGVLVSSAFNRAAIFPWHTNARRSPPGVNAA